MKNEENKLKRCSKCGFLLPPNQFYNKTEGGKFARCKTCVCSKARFSYHTDEVFRQKKLKASSKHYWKKKAANL